MTKNWSPKDLLSTKHLLKERDIIEAKRIARNATAGSWLPYKPGWTYGAVRDNKLPKLNPYKLALDEFETPDDRRSFCLQAKDYSDGSEGPGRVTVCGSKYDIEEAEVFSPYDATVMHEGPDEGWKCKRRATADEENALGLDTESDLRGKMTDAVEAWAGMITPPPKAADPTVKSLIESYLKDGGEVHTCEAYRTTPDSKIKFKFSSPPAWAGGTGIPPEMRRRDKLFRVKSKICFKQWSNAL